MAVTKLRLGADGDAMVPAGQYFKRLAHALREANEREAARVRAIPMRHGRISARVSSELHPW
jgi:hypothetical protein